jgi:hypothetical protein
MSVKKDRKDRKKKYVRPGTSAGLTLGPPGDRLTEDVMCRSASPRPVGGALHSVFTAPAGVDADALGSLGEREWVTQSGQTWWGEAPERSMNFTKRPGESGWKVLLGLNVRRAVAQRWVTARHAYRPNTMIERADGCLLRVIRRLSGSLAPPSFAYRTTASRTVSFCGISFNS